jgi:GIY-YIG catalytic domain
MALITAEHFGIPKHIIHRAEALSAFLPNTAVREGAAANFTAVAADQLANDVHSADISLLLEETSGQKVCEIPPGWNAPASFDGKSVVYILKLNTNPPRFYVGETDNFRKRIEQHRSKGGMWRKVDATLVPAPKGKSQARMWESSLIRKMASNGFDMQSVSDGRRIRTIYDLSNQNLA